MSFYIFIAISLAFLNIYSGRTFIVKPSILSTNEHDWNLQQIPAKYGASILIPKGSPYHGLNHALYNIPSQPPEEIYYSENDKINSKKLAPSSDYDTIWWKKYLSNGDNKERQSIPLQSISTSYRINKKYSTLMNKYKILRQNRNLYSQNSFYKKSSDLSISNPNITKSNNYIINKLDYKGDLVQAKGNKSVDHPYLSKKVMSSNQEETLDRKSIFPTINEIDNLPKKYGDKSDGIKDVSPYHEGGKVVQENEEEEKRIILPNAQKYHADFPQLSVIKKWNFDDVRFATITIGTAMIFLILIVMVLALRVHLRNRQKSAQQWISHPVVQPTTGAPNGLQPSFRSIFYQDHVNAEPIRIKAKGLLERRGSNTSLKIDLGPSTESSDMVISPSRECTPEDFLMTAGSRMSRRQLRQCLKDPRDLHAEFWQIPTNHPDKCGVPGAAAKNRYRTVLPNEETRVVLYNAPPDSPEAPASQYINANYIKGYEGEEKAYIATQGPLAHTIEDLWLMVIQERSPAVIMITRLKENGRVKCEQYVPSYSDSYGSINVTVKQIIQKNGYTIRQIFLKRGDEIHTTLHYWFTSWPDHKTPSSARHLLAMASEVEAARKESTGPVVVHCSAGIGRTGCFIGVSIGRLQLLEEDCVDILSIACQMRLDRGGMVQTAEQYEFIHRALALYEASLPTTASSE